MSKRIEGTESVAPISHRIEITLDPELASNTLRRTEPGKPDVLLINSAFAAEVHTEFGKLESRETILHEVPMIIATAMATEERPVAPQDVEHTLTYWEQAGIISFFGFRNLLAA